MSVRPGLRSLPLALSRAQSPCTPAGLPGLTSGWTPRAAVPSLFGARDRFRGRQFSHGPGPRGREDGFGMPVPGRPGGTGPQAGGGGPDPGLRFPVPVAFSPVLFHGDCEERAL